MIRELARRYPIASYLAVAYAWSWTWWLGTHAGLGPAPTGTTASRWIVFLVVGAAGPTLSAILVASLRGQRAELLRGLLRWRASLLSYLAALIVPMIYFVGGAGLYSLVGGTTGPARLPNPGPLAMSVIAALPFGPMCEELGWRGYLLPILQSRSNALVSSVIVGTVWWGWHAPLMWMASGTLISGEPVTIGGLLLYLAATVSMAIFFTWLMNHTGNSVPIAILAHASVNSGMVTLVFAAMAPDAVRPAAHWAVPVMVVIALLLVAIEGPARLRRGGA